MKKFCLIALLSAMPLLSTAAHADALPSTGKLAPAHVALAAIAVPEPASVSILAVGGVSLLMRRRKAR